MRALVGCACIVVCVRACVCAHLSACGSSQSLSIFHTLSSFAHDKRSPILNTVHAHLISLPAATVPPCPQSYWHQVVNGCNIFARASPENKLRIVRALQTGPGYQGPMDGDDDDDDGPPRSSACWSCVECTQTHTCLCCADVVLVLCLCFSVLFVV